MIIGLVYPVEQIYIIYAAFGLEWPLLSDNLGSWTCESLTMLLSHFRSRFSLPKFVETILMCGCPLLLRWFTKSRLSEFLEAKRCECVHVWRRMSAASGYDVSGIKIASHEVYMGGRSGWKAPVTRRGETTALVIVAFTLVPSRFLITTSNHCSLEVIFDNFSCSWPNNRAPLSVIEDDVSTNLTRYFWLAWRELVSQWQHRRHPSRKSQVQTLGTTKAM